MRKVYACILISYVAWSQPADQVSEKLQDYYDHYKPLVIQLHFNQPAYAPGDTAYFRMAFLDAGSLLPIKGYQLIFLDLTDEDGLVIQHQEFRIRDGWGGNQLAIPSTLKPGVYRIFVYNNWMKNFGKDFFYKSDLYIAGSIELQRITRQTSLQVRAEGNMLVAGLQNRLVISGAGKGPITIADMSNNILLTQSADTSGLTSVIFTPPAAGQYTIRTSGSRTTIAAQNDGVVLRFIPAVSADGTHRVVLSIPPHSALRSEELQVLISHHNVLALGAFVRFSEKNSAVLSLPVKSLPQGINYLCVNNAAGETLASRIFFNPYFENVACSISVDSLKPGTRQKLTAKIKLTDLNHSPLQARISATVYNQSLFSRYISHHYSITDYIRWVRDVALPVDMYPNLSDNILILSEWPWYRWKDVLGSYPENKYLFTDFQEIRGYVVNKLTGQPIRDSLQISFLVARTNDFYEINTDRNGAFSLTFLFPFEYEADVFFRIEKNGNKLNDADLKLEIPAYTYTPASHTTTPTGNSDNYFSYVNLYREVTNSYRYFGEATYSKAKDNLYVKLEKELGDADVVIDPDDYVLFPTMQEMLHEIIPYLQYRKAGSRETVRMYLPELARSGSESPLFIIDGILTDDADFFLKLHPADVDKIKIYYTQFKTRRLGSMSRNGIVIVETKLPGYASKVAASARSFKMQGLTPYHPFPLKPENWQVTNTRAPRLRSTLYFNPYIRLDDNGEATFTLTTTDEVGTFVVYIEGLTTDGRPFTARKEFIVKYTAD